MDHITKAAKAKLKEFKTLRPQQKDALLKSSTSMLKSKKKVISHGDTISKLKHVSFNPKLIVKNIQITASKRAIESKAFKQVANHNKARQKLNRISNFESVRNA